MFCFDFHVMRIGRKHLFLHIYFRSAEKPDVERFLHICRIRNNPFDFRIIGFVPA